MRLHTALDHIRTRAFRTMEPWEPGEVGELVRFIEHKADETIEFTFDFVNPDQTSDTLQTFIAFADDMWDATIAPIPFPFFWVSWTQKILSESVKMAAFCEKVESPIDRALIGLSVRVMFENAQRTGFAFVNQLGLLTIGDHKNAVVNYTDTESAGLIVENGFAIVKALLGALATPQAIRREEAAPEKLNKARAKKGREVIRTLIVIDVRASQQARQQRRGEGGWTVEPHWRRGTIRTLADGRKIPVAPCWVNTDGSVPLKPEYLVRA